jgi:ATP/maltotriose-dependent transcriptional regulator MalT
MTQPPLQGRKGPLRTLRAALAAGQEGQFLLISGDAGIGKSPLATAFAAEAEAAGVAVTWGRAWEFADAPPYFPVWPCLRFLGLDARGDPDGEQHEQEQALQLWETALASLASAAAKQPLLWIVEDLHAADLGTLDLLTFLLQPLPVKRSGLCGRSSWSRGAV